MKFYLGTHMPNWLGLMDAPLFVSHVRLAPYKKLPRALGPWALDSGGFTQLSQHGAWTVTPKAYAAAVRRYAEEIGQLDWAAPQDWMCEPAVRERTRLAVADHQYLTRHNYLKLRTLASDLPWIPVLQGWEPDDYLRHVDMYEQAGIDLTTEPLVGLGTICRRQDTGQADQIIRSLAPLRLHGFGVKTTGLLRFGHRLASADSMAWSYNARKNPRIPSCTHKTCANCPEWAARWRTRVLAKLADIETSGRQGDLFDPDEAWSA